jgi:uncharacterized membrane protein
VPRNNRLGEMEPGGPEAFGYWPTYLTEWTRWNHVRTAASLAGSALLIGAIHVA